MADLTKLTFRQAIAYFARKLNIPTDDWKAIQGEENDWAFTVAGITQADMLADFRAAVDRYLSQGVAFEQFAKDYKAIAQRYGWEPKQGVAWRAEIAARTNLRMAYAAGQYQQRQNPAVKQLRPGLLWRHRDSPNERPHHKELDGKVFEADKVDWSLPSGFGCRCRFLSVPTPENGYFELSDRLPYTLPSGKTTEIPALKLNGTSYPVADPGFFYLPGASPKESRPALFQQMLQRQPPTLQRLIRRSLPARILQKFLPQGFGNGIRS